MFQPDLVQDREKRKSKFCNVYKIACSFQRHLSHTHYYTYPHTWRRFHDTRKDRNCTTVVVTIKMCHCWNTTNFHSKKKKKISTTRTTHTISGGISLSIDKFLSAANFYVLWLINFFCRIFQRWKWLFRSCFAIFCYRTSVNTSFSMRIMRHLR